jgi:hypothetical protein
MANHDPGLLTELDTFYELGCGDQPKGSMGDLKSLNVKRNSLPLLTMLNSLFIDPQTSSEVKRLRQSAYSNAFYTLGMLGYNTRAFGEARKFLLRAILNDARLLSNKQIIGMWFKSLLGPGLIDLLKSGKQRLAS